MPRLRTKSFSGESNSIKKPVGRSGVSTKQLISESKKFANRLPATAEWNGFVARLPKLKTSVETNLLGVALERYAEYCRQAGLPGGDIVSQAVQKRILLEIYGLASRQCHEVLQERRAINRLSPGRELANASDVLQADGSVVWGDEIYAAACSELAYGVSRHCQTYYGIDDIDRYAKSQLISMGEHGARVDTNVSGRLLYLSDEQAVHYRATIRSGNIFVESAGVGLELLDTTQMLKSTGNTAHLGSEHNNYNEGTGRFGPSVGVAGFAMTLNRDLFIHGGHSIRSRDNAAFSFYHSSYVSGEDVLCTGCMTTVNGKLVYINNWSGHYRPPPAQLQIVIESLQVRGVDISDVVVEYKTTGGNDVRSARHFMQVQTPNPGRAAEPDALWFRERVSEVGEAFVNSVKRIIDGYEREKEGFFRRKSNESKAVSHFFADFFATGNPDANCLFSIIMLLSGNLSSRYRTQVQSLAGNFGCQSAIPDRLKRGSTLEQRLVDAALSYHATLRS